MLWDQQYWGSYLLGGAHGGQAIYLVKEDDGGGAARSLVEKQPQLALRLTHPARTAMGHRSGQKGMHAWAPALHTSTPLRNA